MNIYSGLAKNQDRKKIDTQIFTGNIAVDFTKPIAKGNFVVFNGTVNTGNSFPSHNLIAQEKHILLLKPQSILSKIASLTNQEEAKRLSTAM